MDNLKTNPETLQNNLLNAFMPPTTNPSVHIEEIIEEVIENSAFIESDEEYYPDSKKGRAKKTKRERVNNDEPAAGPMPTRRVTRSRKNQGIKIETTSEEMVVD